MKLNKSSLAKALANKDSISEGIERQAKVGGGSNLMPLLGHRELKVKEARTFGENDKHTSVRCFIDGLTVCADYTFFNLNAEPHERTLSDFILFMALLGFDLNNDDGRFLNRDGGEYLENLDQDKGGIIGKEFSGIVLSGSEHNGYNSYNVISSSKAGGGSSVEWLKGQWDYNVLGLDRAGKFINDNPFYQHSSNIEHGYTEYLKTAYDFNEGDDYNDKDVSEAAAPEGSPAATGLDGDIPF